MLMIITISVVINNTNTKSKTAARIVLISSAITAVTIALVTATVVTVMVVSMIPVQKVAASDGGEHCISSPNGKAVACSGSQGPHSCSPAGVDCGAVGSSSSVSLDSKGFILPFHVIKEAHQAIPPAQLPPQVRAAHNYLTN